MKKFNDFIKEGAVTKDEYKLWKEIGRLNSVVGYLSGGLKGLLHYVDKESHDFVKTKIDETFEELDRNPNYSPDIPFFDISIPESNNFEVLTDDHFFSQNGSTITIHRDPLIALFKEYGIELSELKLDYGTMFNTRTDHAELFGTLSSYSLNGEITPREFVKIEDFLNSLEEVNYAFVSTQKYQITLEFAEKFNDFELK